VLIESRTRGAPIAEGDARVRVRKPLFAGVRTRVLVSFLALLVVSTAASLFVLRQVLMSRIGDQVERQLTADLEPLQTLEGRPLGETFNVFLRRTPPPADGAFIAFIDGEPADVKLAGTAGRPLVDAFAGLADIDQPTSGEVETALGEAQYVAVTATSADHRGVLVATELIADERDQVESAVRIAIGVSLVVLLLASLFIWLAAGRAVAPLKALSRTARDISETDLSGRIPVRGGDEIAELGRTFNGMLDRLEVAFAGQKDFLTDVSHELRTPITVIRGHIETLGDSPAERQEAIGVIQDELDRMSRFVDDLLLLAKAPRPDFLRTGPVDVDLFTRDLFGKARSLGERDWRFDGTGIGIVEADQQRLTQAVMNLADNAVRHTRDAEPIWIGSSTVADQVRLWVRDEGAGIPPADRERIFERHERGDTQRPGAHPDGAGLGLAIVRAIAEAHGGHVELDTHSGVGSTFTIVIPANGQPP
jgi:two-component system OmpR family sensor kinase